MVRPTFIDMNPNELKYTPFMISLNKCTGNFNALYPKLSVPKETKDVKVFNMITNKDEAKAMTEHFSFDCKCKFNSTRSTSKHKWNNKTYQCECKNYHKYEKGYSLNPIACICENSNYLKSAVDNSVTKSDEILIAMNNSSTKR